MPISPSSIEPNPDRDAIRYESPEFKITSNSPDWPFTVETLFFNLNVTLVRSSVAITEANCVI